MTNRQTKTKSLIVADYFIKKNQSDGRGLTNKKLQKLLYYSQAWSLVVNNKKMFGDSIEAWVHGPAIPAVYSAFKKFGFSDIDAKVDDSLQKGLSIDDKKILDEVWRVYGKFDGGYLELLTHNELPWQEARKEIKSYEASGNEISLNLMKSYYGEKIKKKA